MSFVLVTGGAGFIGSRLVARLRERGENVCVLDLAPPASSGDIQGSILDETTAKAACADVDVVFHLAGNAQLWARNPKNFDEVNFRGTKVMLAAARAQGVRRFIHCSTLTTLVGRRTAAPSLIDEHTRLEAGDMLGAYPRSKLLAERAVEAAAAEGFDAVMALPTEPLGPGDARLTPPTRMILDFVNGKTPAYIDCVLNFTPIDSLADGLIAVRERGRRGQRYILGGENIDMRSLLDAIERATGRSMPKTKLPYAMAWFASAVSTGLAYVTSAPPRAPLTGVRLAGRRVSFSSEKAHRELEWKATAFEPALWATINWFKQQGLLSR